MCTVILLFQLSPVAPVVVAANRDEFYERPSVPPELLFQTFPKAIGGRDLRHGGSWMGINECGLLVALTNVRSTKEGQLSRGQIVLDALRCENQAEVSKLLEKGRVHEQCQPFNLLYGTGKLMSIAYARPEGLNIKDVQPGLHVLPSNGVLDDPNLPKVSRAQQLSENASAADNWEDLRMTLTTCLADRWIPPVAAMPVELRNTVWGLDGERQIQAINVNTPSYGTCSSTFITVGYGPLRYYFSDGPLDAAELRPYHQILKT